MLNSLTITIGGVTLVGSARPEIEGPLRGVLETFRPFAAEFRDGFSLQVGWGPVVLKADGDDRYVLRSPDYAGHPADLTDDLTLTLWVLTTQTAVVRAAGIEEPAPIRYTDSVVFNRAALDADRRALTRSEPVEGDSGWFVDVFPQGTEELGADDLVKFQAFEVLRVNRHLVSALLLPVGVAAVVNGDGVETVFRESTFEVLANRPLQTTG